MSINRKEMKQKARLAMRDHKPSIYLITLVFLLILAVLEVLSTKLQFPGVGLLGASGVVFAFILISSITVREDHTIPVTFILVAVMYLGQQIYQGLFVKDNISQMAHIVGGAVGSAMGLLLSRKKKQDRF